MASNVGVTRDVKLSFPPQVALPPSKAWAESKPHEDDDLTTFCVNRAASFSSISDHVAHGLDPVNGKSSFSDLNLSRNVETPPLSKDTLAMGKDLLRRVSTRASKPKTAASRFTPPTEELENDAGNVVPESQADEDPAQQDLSLTMKPVHDNNLDPQQPGSLLFSSTPAEPPARLPSKAQTVSGKLATLARRSWIGSSAPSSYLPPTTPVESKSRSVSRNKPESKRGFSRSRDSSPPRSNRSLTKSSQLSESETVEETTREGSGKRSSRQRPLSAFISRRKSIDLSPEAASTPSLRSRLSVEKLLGVSLISAPAVPPLPRIPPSWSSNPQLDRKRDELWGTFRALEADCHKFQSKSSALKINSIRSTLLPFLSRGATETSVRALRPEDLDRRVNILNQWWTALLEVLNGRNHHPISGIDRPVYLEAVAGLMMRPEWRVPFPSTPVNPSVRLQESVAACGSHTSLDSIESNSLVESIQHNIRTIFIRNLFSQMAFVVERMSMRHAPASMVAFCGKACAYAFFFCPGVADMLVRLWNTPPDIYRRVLAASTSDNGLERRSARPEILSTFPPAIRNLAFSSHVALARYLRQSPNLPLNATKIPWHGPWLSRWCGRDTDFFFVFIKYFHILLSEYLPSELGFTETVRAPSVLVVHGQLLVVLEDTIYKQSTSLFEETPSIPDSTTFDDFMEGADASVAVLPFGAANCHRSMAENRLVALLRDFLSEPSPESSKPRRLFASSFHEIMKAAARKISLFDHKACFVLCDFVEEVISTLLKYSRSIQVEIFDWTFWLQVCKRMLHSENSLTEVRVFAFIYGVWDIWTNETNRKRDLCVNFLLSDTLFYRYFSHWSPMVRAYFHRLLCWRVARCPDDLSPVDLLIHEMLLDRLEQIYSYYTDFQVKAVKELRAPLSSAPCSPAPGRRIVILRSESPPSPDLLPSFDSMMGPSSLGQMSAYRSHGTLTLDLDGLPPDLQPPQKRRWSLLKNMFSAPMNPKPGEVTPPGSRSDETEANLMGNYLGNQESENNPLAPWDHQTGHDEFDDPPTRCRPFSFRFSLEWLARPQWPSKNKRLYPPRIPVTTQLHIQRHKALEMRYRDSDGSLSADVDGGGYEDGRSGPDTDTSTSGNGSQRSCETDKTSVDSSGGVASTALRNERVMASKYAGRALAEWAQVVSECDSFFERRRDEGVPCHSEVETPMLSVDSFRK